MEKVQEKYQKCTRKGPRKSQVRTWNNWEGPGKDWENNGKKTWKLPESTGKKEVTRKVPRKYMVSTKKVLEKY